MRDDFCTLHGPGRGDCEHAVGLPAELNSETCDEYGIPHGWCAYCWVSFEKEMLEIILLDREGPGCFKDLRQRALEEYRRTGFYSEESEKEHRRCKTS